MIMDKKSLEKLYYRALFKVGEIRGNLDSKLTRLRFKNKKYTNIPFYDKREDIYRVFFDDRFDEFGSLEYVVGEYIKDGLIYHYRQKGSSLGDDFVDHEHSFREILDVITRYRGRGFSIKGFEHEYSQQELNIINKYIAKLKEDTRPKKKRAC